MKNNNELKYCMQQMLYTILNLMLVGSVLQTFMIESGIPETKVSLYVSFMQIVQMFIMIAFSKVIEKCKNVIEMNAKLMLFQIPPLLLMLYLCFNASMPVQMKYAAFFVIGTIFNIGLGLLNVVSYKLPYHVLDMERYGTVTGESGLLAGITGICYFALLSYFQKKHEYFAVMKPFLFFGIIFAVLTVILTATMESVGDCVPGEVTQKKHINIFTYKPFYILFLPNLMRGLNYGTIAVMVAVGYYLKLLNAHTAGLFIVITNVSMFAGSAVYTMFARCHMDKWVILIASAALAVMMPAMCIGRNTAVFLALYALCYFMIQMIGYAVPVLVTKIVDYDVIGQYTAWRMLLFTMGSAISGSMFIKLIDFCGVYTAFTIAGAMQLISGMAYFVYAVRNKRI